MRQRPEKLLQLLDEHGPGLHALLFRLTLREDVAEELLQELFIKLSRTSRFNAVNHTTAYLYRSAVNLAFDWRRRQRRRRDTTPLEIEPAVNDNAPLDTLVQQEEWTQMLDALGQLSELNRTAFVMRHIQQEPYESIAEQLGKTVHQVRALCHKGLAQMRSLLNKRN